ncbi:MAG: hypothetical protein GY863_14770 [bacterium]|nr:hypothetical protein [bacterium]
MSGMLDSLAGPVLEGYNEVTDDDIRIINELENPPLIKLEKDDVYVRKCRLTGDGINCHYGKFHTKDLPVLLKKTQGVSCLFGHRKETAGIARFFGGSIEKHEVYNPVTGMNEALSFIVPKIYWMKSHSFAEDLRVNIDGGIYHQASISWYFEKPVCGLCGMDIRKCDHVPGKTYGKELCFYWYEQLGEVLEGSIVYAGGHPGTGFELNDNAKVDKKKQKSLFKFRSEERLYKNDILPYLKNIPEGSIYLCGELAQNGWTDGNIKIIPDRSAMYKVGDLLPFHLAGRLEIRNSLDHPGNYVRISSNMIADVRISLTTKNKNRSSIYGSTRKDNFSGPTTDTLEFEFIYDDNVISIKIFRSEMDRFQAGHLCPVEFTMKDQADGMTEEKVIVHKWEKGSKLVSVSNDDLQGVLSLKEIKIDNKTKWYISKIF